MTPSLLHKLCCPVDKHDLEHQVITETEEGEILEALLSCPECGRYFPVIYGIPILIPDEYRDESMERPLLREWSDMLDGLPEPGEFRLPGDTPERQE